MHVYVTFASSSKQSTHIWGRSNCTCEDVWGQKNAKDLGSASIVGVSPTRK